MTAQLRQAIEQWGQSRYSICKATGIPESHMSRFMSGERGLSVKTLDTLCDYLGLELRQSKRRKSKGR